MTLWQQPVGKHCLITRYRALPAEFKGAGLREGDSVSIIIKYRSSLILGYYDTRIACDKKLAERVFVYDSK